VTIREASTPRFIHRIRIRYGEVDQQGIVFNAHYLAFVDDAMDSWLRSWDVDFGSALDWDPMVKKAEVEWHGPAGVGDVLEIGCRVEVWGTTSLTVRFDVSATRQGDAERAVATARVIYVGVRFGTTDPVPPPAEIRTLLGG
jgi:acyl-CoA thioester hydrolase